MSLYSLLSRFFEWEIRLVCRWPMFFLIGPIVVTVCLLFAAIQTNSQNEGKEQSLDIFLPDSMESLRDLKELLRRFPPQDALRDSYSLFGSSFAYAIFEDISASDGGNILKPQKLKQVAELHKMIVRNISSPSGHRFMDVCFREEANSTCTQHPIMIALEDPQADLAIKLLARYPTLRLSGNIAVDNAIVFGGVQLSQSRVDKHGNAAIEKAKAIRLFYVLESSDAAVEWIRTFLKRMGMLRIKGADLFYTSSISLPNEMERNGELLVPWMPWMIGLLIAFCGLICAKWDPVQSQPLIGLGAISSMATLISIEYPFMHMILIMPFLILSIGVDNMFLMLRSWRSLYGSCRKSANSKRLNEADAIFVDAISEVSVSIFVTSLTDGISFAIGTFSDFIAVRVFCTYCWLAILYMFLYQATFLTALMALQCRREASNRHWLYHCLIIPSQNDHRHKIERPNSGHFNCQPSRQIYAIAAQIIQHPITKYFTLAFYLAYFYLYAATSWIAILELGLNLKLLTPDGSYVAKELRAQERLFAEYGPFGYCVIFMDANVNATTKLWEREQRLKLIEFYHKLTSGEFASKGDFWLEAFDGSKYSEELHYDDEERFMEALIKFIEDPKYNKYRTDIQLNDSTAQIEAIKMSTRIRKLGHENDEPRANFLRSTMAQSGYAGFVYDTTFLLVDQQAITKRNMMANILCAIFVMLFISVIFVPRTMASLCVAFTLLSINVGVVGALSAVKTRLDIISMITIVMSVGLSFDYATHVTFHFLLYRRNRIENTLRAVGIPILQAAASTIVGVSVLAIVPSYMVRTFVYTVFFVVTIGLVHALYFLPVLLNFAVPVGEYLEMRGNDRTSSSSSLSIRELQLMAMPTIPHQALSTPMASRRNSIIYFY